jgi:cobalt-zinc-cadmium efflux system membrane fusion protein
LALAVLAAAAASASAAEALPRVEARSQDLMAVGVVRGDKMIIHLSRIADNAPVHDAAMTVVLRGAAHAATAETDGSYALQTKDLALPGAAAVEFQVNQGTAHESLKGTLEITAAGAQQGDKSSNARQLWWWVLNFAVCIGFLWLFTRRRKSAQS